MDFETAQRIERLEFAVGVLCRHLGLDLEAVLSGHAVLQPIVADAVPPGFTATPQPGVPGLPPEFYALVREGKKIKAIAMYRQLTGVGLKEAKDYVDGLG
jgi:hypothetical protein